MNDYDERNIANEETALLPPPKPKQKVPTPLPKLQIAIVLILQMCEPMASQSILPYINQLVSELDITGGDERKVGYYAGLIESLFFMTEALFVLQWSRVSDYIGRKPILLVGLGGTALSMLSFGLSKTFLWLVISRCLCGLLNGNIGVMKSVMGELTDPSNRADGFALMPVVWAAGATIGPMIGGTLSRPHERFPEYFGGSFWKEYPYFLPCLAVASLVLSASLFTLLYLKETVPTKRPIFKRTPSPASDRTLSDARTSDDPVPLRELFTYPVVISISNYVILAFMDIATISLLPLFFAMPLEIGGLGLDPPTIGYTLGIYGAGAGIYQALFFAKNIRRFGARTVFVTGMGMFLPIFTMIPVISLVAQYHNGVTNLVWVLVAMVLAMMAWMHTAYGCIFMYVTASAPNRRSLGATNGLSQTSVSIARAIGPAMSTSLFSLSVERNLLWGYAVYMIMFICGVGAMSVAVRLPKKVWDESDDL